MPTIEVIDNATGAMCLVGQYGHFLHCNKAWCEMVGYSNEELKKLTWMDMTVKEDIELDQYFVDALVSRDLPTYQTTKQYIKKDGKLIKVQLSVIPIFELGHFKYFISQAIELKDFSNV